MKAVATTVISIAVLAGCQSFSSHSDESRARAVLEAKSGSAVNGQVDFKENRDKVKITAKVTGLKPNSQHGFHVHEKGDCTAADASSAGGHFNPESQPHGNPQHGSHHTGDLPNLTANDKGEATLSFETNALRLDDGKHGILNRAVVIHANPDDYQSQPAGNSGSRIACGVIKKT